MYTAGQIIYFTPFYFKNGNSAKNKYFIVLKTQNEESVLASLPTRRDSIPQKETPEHGCVELPEINLNCFVISPEVAVTCSEKYFDFPTHIYGHQLDTFSLDHLNDIYKIEGSDYEIWGQMKPAIFEELMACLKHSKMVKRKSRRMLD